MDPRLMRFEGVDDLGPAGQGFIGEGGSGVGIHPNLACDATMCSYTCFNHEIANNQLPGVSRRHSCAIGLDLGVAGVGNTRFGCTGVNSMS